VERTLSSVVRASRIVRTHDALFGVCQFLDSYTCIDFFVSWRIIFGCSWRESLFSQATIAGTRTGSRR